MSPIPWRSLVARLDPGDPRPYRGPFTRWPRTSDALLAAAMFVVSLLTVAASAVEDGRGLTTGSITDLAPAAVVLLAVAAGSLVERRRHPVGVAVFLAGVLIVWALAGFGDGQDIVLVIAMYSVGRYTADPRVGLATVVGVIAVSIAATAIDPSQRVDIVPAVIFGAGAWYVGRRVRNRGDYLALLRERARILEAEQQARARRAVVEERSRIARELHDVVAHQVSMMTVQAGAAKTIARDDPDAAIEAMGDVESAGRRALGELRHLLGVLRTESDGHGADDLGPQRGLADIPSLAESLRRTGAEVTVEISDPTVALPTAVDLSAFRIVQESLTNVVKHAGPEPKVEIRVDADDTGLDIEIVNTVGDTIGQVSDLPESGFGIAGMTERAVLLGGTLQAERRAPDRFVVEAHLPLGGPST
ncbi:MAG TPA: sensor histidine kinase [Acidimicrobiales bacterium]|nr:sensor histidine kinase [Acidimicrobiales bacterium]